MINTELLQWMAVSRIPGFGVATALKMQKQFGSLKKFFEARESAWRHHLSEKVCHAIKAFNWSSLNPDLYWMAKPNHNIISIDDDNYPPLLKEINSPPPVLYIKGDETVLSRPQIAIVGSRHASRWGEQTALRFARELSSEGLVITSGLARGIDAASHHAALQCQQATVAVMGTSFDQIYPSQHQTLVDRIAEYGAVISEFPLGTPTLAQHFPRRNRIISGLSLGALIVEATLQSGSLITARMAAEQGREVFAVPGSVYLARSQGCHSLIRQGAKVTESVADILEELPADLSLTPPPITRPLLTLAPRNLLSYIGSKRISADEILIQSGLTYRPACPMLVLLEIQGLIHLKYGEYRLTTFEIEEWTHARHSSNQTTVFNHLAC